MDACYYCRHRNGQHDPNCPQGDDPNWQYGWKDGRRGWEAVSTHPRYLLGYSIGIVALEESENGRDPRAA
jgi:hypothetical protein